MFHKESLLIKSIKNKFKHKIIKNIYLGYFFDNNNKNNSVYFKYKNINDNNKYLDFELLINKKNIIFNKNYPYFKSNHYLFFIVTKSGIFLEPYKIKFLKSDIEKAKTKALELEKFFNSIDRNGTIILDL